MSRENVPEVRAPTLAPCSLLVGDARTVSRKMSISGKTSRAKSPFERRISLLEAPRSWRTPRARSACAHSPALSAAPSVRHGQVLGSRHKRHAFRASIFVESRPTAKDAQRNAHHTPGQFLMVEDREVACKRSSCQTPERRRGAVLSRPRLGQAIPDCSASYSIST
jgi:hypothetical protein